MAEVSEKAIVDAILADLNRLPSMKAIKIHGSVYSRRGTPDIIGCHRGKMFAIEVKTPSGRLTPSQKREIEAWKKAGAIAGVATSVGEARVLLGLARNITQEEFQLIKDTATFLGDSTLERASAYFQRGLKCAFCGSQMIVLPGEGTFGQGWVFLKCRRCDIGEPFPEMLLSKQV